MYTQRLRGFSRDRVHLVDGKSHNNALLETLSWCGNNDIKQKKGRT